jgi:signal transduction histidine kinase
MQYAWAILAVGAAAVLTHAFWRVTATAPTAPFILAVGISAWMWGMGPGLTASVVALIGVVLLIGDVHSLSTVELLRIASLLPIALFIGHLHARKTRAEESLHERDARLQLVSEQIPGGLWSTDAELRFTSGFGAQAGLLHGRPGTTLFEHFRTTDNSFPAIAAHRRALRGESSTYEVEWSGRTFQAYVEPLRDAEGGIIGVVGVANDVTERKASERERERLVAALETQHDRLKSTNQAKDRFLAMLSHELRTPLTPVMALVSSLCDREGLPEDLREDVETIRRNVVIEATLIDDLLDLTRIDRGKLRLHPQDVDVHELLRAVAQICRPDGQVKQVTVDLELTSARSYVRGDPARLKQVFWNLLKNAIKFSPQGGRVVVRTADREGRILVEVIDHGIGITPTLLPRLFDAFEQGEPSITRQFGGLGLGLAISKSLVDAHHGRLTAASDGPGKGATFGVELETVSPALPAASTGLDPRVATGVTRSLRILLVEDHADTAAVTQKLLRAAGHRVETAASVAAALRMVGETPVDLVISDVGLPDGTGHELLTEIRRTRPVKAIALSGYGSEEDVQRSLAAGFEAHLTKPVPMSVLRRVIANVAEEAGTPA